MRPFIVFVLWLIASTAFAQFEYAQEKPGNLGQAIGVGAAKSVADLEQRIATLEQLVPAYIPTWTWAGHDGPSAFDRLRVHMAGENVHPARDVRKWSRAELAFVHDCDHVEEYLAQGKALPVLKDQRLRDWLRAKSPAKALPKRLGWAVKRIVMHTQPNCPPCDRWRAENLAALQADGVEFVEAGPDGRPTPSFDVQFCDGDQCRTLMLGNMRYETMKNMQL
jgi:hypothetical protein